MRPRRKAKRSKKYFSDRDVCIIKVFSILAGTSSLLGLYLQAVVHSTLIESTPLILRPVIHRAVESMKHSAQFQPLKKLLSPNAIQQNDTNSASLQQESSIMLHTRKNLSQWLLQAMPTPRISNYNPHLELYNPRKAPILEGWSKNANEKVRVRILLFEHTNSTQSHGGQFRSFDKDYGDVSDELYNIAMDGFNRSSHFELLGTTLIPDFHEDPNFMLPEDKDVVWVVDERRRVYNNSYTIPAQLLYLANATRAYQKKLRGEKQLPQLRVVLMDYRDHYFPVMCTAKLTETIRLLGGPQYLRSVRNMLVRGRHWDGQFVATGSLEVSRMDQKCLLHPVQPSMHASYTVRSDLAQAIEDRYIQFLSRTPKISTESSLSSSNTAKFQSPADTTRPTDVAHFWPAQKKDSLAANLRHTVTREVLSLGNSTISIGSEIRRLKVIGDFVSQAGFEGRSLVNMAYVDALLTTKIVVVAQRDDWEDHYRLFESLAGGALVLTDPMWSLPNGLVNGTHLVVYRSMKELRYLIMYYLEHENERLEIARAGWQESLTNHRSHHEMEKLFFGSILSPP